MIFLVFWQGRVTLLLLVKGDTAPFDGWVTLNLFE